MENGDFDWEAWFRQFPGKNWLSEKWCKGCRKTILVAETEPIPPSQIKMIEGMPAYHWDPDTDERFLGWLCNECAWKLAGESKGGIAFGGAMLPDFFATSCDLTIGNDQSLRGKVQPPGRIKA